MKSQRLVRTGSAMAMVFAVVSLAAQAQAGWTQRGTLQGLPSNSEHITAIGVKGQRIIVGTTSSGVYLSDDSGGTWRQPTGTSPPIGFISGIVTLGDRMIAGYLTPGHGVYVSDDDGENWQVISTGLTTGSQILGAFNGKVFMSSGSLYVSGDQGATWQKQTSNLPVLGNVWAATAIGGTYYCTIDKTVYKSTDLITWQATVSNGLPVQYLRHLVTSGTHLVVNAAGVGVFVSSDAGENWAPVTGLAHQTSIRYLFAHGDLIIAATGLYNYVSFDDGATWAQLDTGFPQPTGMTVLGATATTLVAGQDTTTQGSLWTRELPAPPVASGDVDGSGTVDMADAVLALQALSGQNADNAKTGADINGDGRIGHAEALFVIQTMSLAR